MMHRVVPLVALAAVVFTGCAPDPGMGGATTTTTTVPPPTTQRVNVSNSGVEDNAGVAFNARSHEVTADGATVYFSSGGSALAPDVNPGIDVFRRDLTTGSTTVVGLNAAGQQPAVDVTLAGMSSNGRYLLLQSIAPLAGETADGLVDLYRRDTVTGQVLKASPAGISTSPRELTIYHQLSDDGRFVIFRAPDSTVFRRDLVTSISTAVPYSVEAAAMSGNGRYVAISTPDPAGGPIDDNGVNDYYLIDTFTSGAQRMSIGTPVNDPGIFINGALSQRGSPRITPDGRFVLFSGTNTPLLRFDRLSGRNYSLGQGFAGDLSDDGSVVATHVTRAAPDPGGPVANGALDEVVVIDTTASTTRVVSRAPSGADADGDSAFARLSADGRTVVYASGATNLVANDLNRLPDVFATRLTP